jgi:hypothetical protein
MFFKKIFVIFDKIEDKVRGRLSRYPILYAFVGGAGIIIFWRGIWVTIDYIMEFFRLADSGNNVPQMLWWDGPLSTLVGAVLLLIVGLFVTSFVGNEIIISGLRKEKRIAEKTKEELEAEINENNKNKRLINQMNNRLKRIEKTLINK